MGVCACVFGRCCRNIRGGRGPCSRPSSSLGAPHWPVAVKKLLPPLTVGLVAHAQDDFRGAVIAGNHVGRHEEASGGRPGKAKVQDLQCAVRLHHDVTGLQVLSRKTQHWDSYQPGLEWGDAVMVEGSNSISCREKWLQSHRKMCLCEVWCCIWC